MARISPMLSKLLNDVEVDFPAVSDSEIIKANEELTNTMAEAKESSADAEMLSEAISDLEVAKEDIAAGLESGIDHVSAKLLMANLNNCIKRVDSEGVVSLAGLQSDNVSYTLQAGLLSADGIIKKAVDALKALWRKIVDGVKIIYAKIKQFIAWIFGSSKKTIENLEKAKETIKKTDDALSEIANLPSEVKEEIVKNSKNKKNDIFGDLLSKDQKLGEKGRGLMDEARNSISKINKMLADSEDTKNIVEATIKEAENKALDLKNLLDSKEELLQKARAAYIKQISGSIIKALIPYSAVSSTVSSSVAAEKELKYKSGTGNRYVLADSETGHPDDKSNSLLENTDWLKYGIRTSIQKMIYEDVMHFAASDNVFFNSLANDNSSYLDKNVFLKLASIESYADQIGDVLARKTDFSHKVLESNPPEASYLIYNATTSISVDSNGNFKDSYIQYGVLLGNSFTGGENYELRLDHKDNAPAFRDALDALSSDLEWVDVNRIDDWIKALNKYSASLSSSSKVIDKISKKNEEVSSKINSIVNIIEKSNISKGAQEASHGQTQFISGVREIVTNLNRLSTSIVLYTQAMAWPNTAAKIITENLKPAILKEAESK